MSVNFVQNRPSQFTQKLYRPLLEKFLGERTVRNMHMKEIHWICNKCSNQFSHLRRESDVEMDSFFIAKLNSGDEKPYHDWFRQAPEGFNPVTRVITNQYTGDAYVFGFYASKRVQS